MATIIGMWFALQADIAEAKELPKPDITRMEFNMEFNKDDKCIGDTFVCTKIL